MSTLSIPSTGIPIQHTPADSKEPPQIIRLALADKDTRDLLKHVRQGGNTRLKTGLHRLAIEYGTNRVSLRFGTDKHPQEIFDGPVDGSKPMFFAGKLSHTLEQLQAKEATAGMDTALEKLKNNLKQAQDDRAGSTVNKVLKPQHRPSPLGAGLLGSRPSSPFLKAGFSPHAGPTSAPLLPGSSKQEQTKLNAIRIPVVHLLATEPQEARKLAEKLRVKKADLDQVLLKVARDGKGGLKELKDRSFRELDVWKFPYQSQHDRQAAIDHAISAFDRQRIDKADSLWQMLLAKEDRGKGISLSKLNFDKPIAPGNLTPKVLERSTDGGSTEGKSLNSLGSSQSDQKGKAAITKQTSKPKTVDQIVRSLKTSGKESGRNTPATTKENKKAPPPPKQDVKFKSSEKIENSDDEADAGPAITATTTAKREQPKQPKEQKPFRPEKSSSATTKPALHKPHLPGSSGGNVDNDQGRLTPSSTMVKTRGGKDTVNGEVKAKGLTPSQSRNPSRPRNGSSPAKPSPLGSSPPTNLRDVDSTSNSSKGTAVSSAPSSPPFNVDSSQSKRKNQQSVASERKPNSLINGAKRKAEDHQSTPPAKKLQVNGTSTKHDADRFNSLPKALSDEIARQPKRDTPESDASSVSDKVITKEQIIDDARRFHKYYAKYKALHEKVNTQKASERKDEDVDRVWTMHKRLQEVKDRIWKDWGRLEKMDKI